MPSLAQYRVLLFQLIHASTEPLLAYSGLLLDTCWSAYARCEVATIEPMLLWHYNGKSNGPIIGPVSAYTGQRIPVMARCWLIMA